MEEHLGALAAGTGCGGVTVRGRRDPREAILDRGHRGLAHEDARNVLGAGLDARRTRDGLGRRATPIDRPLVRGEYGEVLAVGDGRVAHAEGGEGVEAEGAGIGRQDGLGRAEALVVFAGERLERDSNLGDRT